MPDFDPISTTKPCPGLVLRLSKDNTTQFLRLTHVFDDCVYAMWVGEPSEARIARRPKRFTLRQLDVLATTPHATWGKIHLPPALLSVPEKNSIAGKALDQLWNLIRPLIEQFRDQDSLSRQNFSKLIARRATVCQRSATTLKRLVFRYYYFGGTKCALLSLPPGSKPSDSQTENTPPLLRRGRQSSQSQKYGKNDFVVSASDIEDMLRVHSKLCQHGSSTVSYTYDYYLANEFRHVHPDEYAAYIDGKRSEPITLRQFRYYTSESNWGDEATRSKRAERRLESKGMLQASSPGEITEGDATGGRFFLVKTDKPDECIGKPYIYIAIDRWSRYITGVYVSLKPPSYDELRYLLLVSMTSREERFRALNVNVTDKEWPPGRLSAVMTFDRGSDFLSESTKQAAADDLRIELTYLPPLCPDGKAIVERIIGVLKRRISSRGLKGSYKDRPLDPKTKRIARNAQSAAVYTLVELYRILIDEVIQHNNRPHPALRRRRVLMQENVEPTPIQAYLWGLKNLGGTHSPPLSDADYQRLLMASGVGYLGNGVCKFKSRIYRPVNSPAVQLAARSSKSFKETTVRYDRTFPETVYIPSKQAAWAEFKMTAESSEDLHGLTLDEEEVLSDTGVFLWSEADTTARRTRVRGLATGPTTSTKRRPAQQEQSTFKAAREQDTKDIKQRLTNKQSAQHSGEDAHVAQVDDWRSQYQKEQKRTLAAIQKQRRSRRNPK